MNKFKSKKLRPVYLVMAIGLAVIPILLMMGAVSTAFGEVDSVTIVEPSQPLTGEGYRDFNYSDPLGAVDKPTGEKAESKLWWNDGYWWGSMYNNSTHAYHIYRLMWGTQTWVDTGVQLDDYRNPLDPKNVKADTMWDDVAKKLYVVSHVFTKNSAPVNEINAARLYRYSYDPILQTYTLDPGFPSIVNQDKSETLTIDKDSAGKLWTTHVSRPSSSGTDYQVYVNASSDGGTTWEGQFTVPSPVPLAASHVMTDDISTLVSYNNHIAVVWSNQSEVMSDTVNLALHPDSTSSSTSGWLYHSYTLPAGVEIDDHISAKSIAVSGDKLFAVFKLLGTNDDDPGIAVVAFDNGIFSFHTYSTRLNHDTRPILVVDEDSNLLYVFVSGKEGGSKICYKTLAITNPASSMDDFEPGDCGIEFILDKDDIYKDINNATSMKGNVSALTGIVVLAADEPNGQYYTHNVMGDPPPVVDMTTPARGAIDVRPEAVSIAASFSKEMDGATINPASFIVKELVSGLPVAGTVSYDDVSKTARFAPLAGEVLPANTTYVVQLTSAIQDLSGTPLNEGIEPLPIRESWQFTITGPPVSFDNLGYTVTEGEPATATVILEAVSPETVMIDYQTVDGTAKAGVDYTTVSDTLTFAPGEISKTFTVTTLNNADADGSKELSLELSNPVKTSLGVVPIATLTIFDDDVPTVRFQNETYPVNEGDGSAMIEVTLSLFPVSASKVTVNFSTGVGGTATAGEDYTPVPNQQVEFAPSESSKTVSVPIIDDDLNELNETVELLLSGPTSPAEVMISNSPAALIIIDNDPEPDVMFSDAAYEVDESDGKAILDVELSTVSGREVTVDFATGGGTATPGVDYEAKTGTVTFAKGQTSQTIEIKILSDGVADPGESFNVILNGADGATLNTPPIAAKVTITDQTVFLPMILSN